MIKPLILSVVILSTLSNIVHADDLENSISCRNIVRKEYGESQIIKKDTIIVNSHYNKKRGICLYRLERVFENGNHNIFLINAIDGTTLASALYETNKNSGFIDDSLGNPSQTTGIYSGYEAEVIIDKTMQE